MTVTQRMMAMVMERMMTTTSSRWRLTVTDHGGRARVSLLDSRSVPIGVVNLSWADYESLVQGAVGLVVGVVGEVLRIKIGQLLWRDAQRDEVWRDISAPGSTAEAAKDHLVAEGWTTERISRLAGELSAYVADALIRRLPRHR